MAALTVERKTPKYGDAALPNFPTPGAAMPVAALAKIYSGALVCLATTGTDAGNLVQGKTATGLICMGVCEATADNSAGIAGALTLVPRMGVFQFNNSGAGADLIATANIGQDCYITDDNTVALTNAGGTKSRCGTIFSVDSGGVWVYCGLFGSTVNTTGLAASIGLERPARVATAAALATYVAANGVLTASANGALGAIDGVTMAVGDRVLVVTGAATADNGLYQITSLGGASSKWTFARPTDWATGAFGFTGTSVQVAEGTLFANTQWKVTTAGNFTVDTTGISLYPREVTQAITLASGTVAVANVPILSATKSQFVFMRTTPSGTANTIQYNTVSITPGAIGTATASAQAQVAAGTINAADGSVGNFTVINW